MPDAWTESAPGGSVAGCSALAPVSTAKPALAALKQQALELGLGLGLGLGLRAVHLEAAGVGPLDVCGHGQRRSAALLERGGGSVAVLDSRSHVAVLWTQPCYAEAEGLQGRLELGRRTPDSATVVRVVVRTRQRRER